MIQEKELKNIVKAVAKTCTADDYTLNIVASDTIETRFAQNRITQHIGGSSATVSIEVVFGGRKGGTSINQLDVESVISAVKKAEDIAQLSEPDPEYVPSVGASECPVLTNHFSATANLTVPDMVNIVQLCIDNAVARDAKISGMTERHILHRSLFTKNGFSGSYESTQFEHSMTMKKDEKETRVSRSVMNYEDFDLQAELKQLNEQFDSLSSPNSLPAGKYNVILRPNAVIDLFSFMLWGFDRRDADDGLNAFSGQMKKDFFGKDFSFTSETEILGMQTSPFTRDGVPTKKVVWAQNGVLENMPVSRFYAKEKGLEHIPSPFNFHIAGGDTSEEEMMKLAGNGIIINRFWYIRVIDRKSGELTGMTRDGVLHFENGKIVDSVNNFRFNEITHEATRRIMALGESVLQHSWAKVPTLLIQDFNFVDTTSF